MYKIGEEEMVICPYDCYHVVSKLRIQRHIMKCKKNNPDVKLATCFYNYSHRLKPENMLAHYEICTHKTRVDGAKYSDPATRPSSVASMKSNLPKINFPEINAKTHFFRDPPYFLPVLNQNFDDDSQKFETSASGLGDEDSYSKPFENTAFKKSRYSYKSNNHRKYNDDSKNYEDVSENENEGDHNYSDDDLEPLPLPKTVSKAFVIPNQQGAKSSSVNSSRNKPFGRGNYLVAFSSSPVQRSTDHLLPDLSDMDSNLSLPKREKTPKFFLRNLSPSCNESIVSSMIDDTATLKSEEVIFDDEFDDGNDDNGFILKNFDKYTKL